uniref:Uncharacterized protein n=1 Tax=viral metagenome TaxID=1070528 RepID=A0A6H1Z8M5_9ZZZZ
MGNRKSQVKAQAKAQPQVKETVATSLKGMYVELTASELDDLRSLQRDSVSRHRAPIIRGALRKLAWLAKLQRSANQAGKRLVLLQVDAEETLSAGSGEVLSDDLDLRI